VKHENVEKKGTDKMKNPENKRGHPEIRRAPLHEE